MRTTSAVAELARLRLAIRERTIKLGPEVSWRINLALDIAGTYPHGPNPLPASTWDALATTLVATLTPVESIREPGAKLATGARLSIEAADRIARRAEPRAAILIARGWTLLEGLTPADVLDVWELHGRTTLSDGARHLLDLLARPPRA